MGALQRDAGWGKAQDKTFQENAMSGWANILEWTVFCQSLLDSLLGLSQFGLKEGNEKNGDIWGAWKPAYHKVFPWQKWGGAEAVDGAQGWEF